MVTNAGSFLQKYVPDGVDPAELIEMAVNAMGDFDWEAIFKPDLIDDCDGFDKDYLGEEEEEEVEKTEEEFLSLSVEIQRCRCRISRLSKSNVATRFP